ncbi:unnamed protein product [Mytilus coruscus]|uniref:Fibrinogen C-terminal domain-containing protein n=1 Tax=Mytilus coruscus TaxID=42192 RepID=A0A6J8C5M6_MYTCO|nr:unnamed protein product [Mytilus coruscus]
MKNFAKDTSKTVKLATEIKNMLNSLYCAFELSIVQVCVGIAKAKTAMRRLIKRSRLSLKVIQKRFDGSVEFTRNWNGYENGFGSINGEFWLGNKNIAQLTSGGSHELRIDLEDWDGNKRYAVFKNFTIGDASTKYRLNINGYSGNAGKYNKI